MKRELKFRAYDKQFDVMLNDIVVWDSTSECIAVLDQPAQWAYGDKLDDRMGLNFEGSVSEWYCFTSGFAIMQYTGLKDKNGIEIYEGDILKQFGNLKPFVVEFFNSAWRANRLYILGTEIKEAAVEIIGNIYQNHELLPNSR